MKLNVKFIVANVFALCFATGSAQATQLTGLFGIDAGTQTIEGWHIYDRDLKIFVPANEGDPGATPITKYHGGSYFTMANPPVADNAVMIEPGSAGGLLLNTYQNFVLDPDEPHPAGHPDAPFGAGSGYGKTPVSEGGILAPFIFFNNPTNVGTNPVSYQSGLSHVAPTVILDESSCINNICSITADLSSWEVMWNGTAFEQGPRPDNTQPFILAEGNYNLLTGFYTLDWRSQILAGSFNGITSSWHLEGTHVVPVPAAAWLFGSGLVGLIGVARRKRLQASTM